VAYSLYILYSGNADRYYFGSSDDPLRRLVYHNTKENGFTARYRPWKIVFQMEFPKKTLARLAEKKVKSWKSRSMTEKLINGEFKLSIR